MQSSESDTKANNTRGGGKNYHNQARGVHFCQGSHGRVGFGQDSWIHRGGHGCSRGGGHGGKKASHDKSKTYITWYLYFLFLYVSFAL